jgi:hypothetical protein
MLLLLACLDIVISVIDIIRNFSTVSVLTALFLYLNMFLDVSYCLNPVMGEMYFILI